MSEKRYFIFWLIVGSLFPLIGIAVQFFLSIGANNAMNATTMSGLEEHPVSILIIGVFGVALSLLFSAIALALGMDFAKRIGAKLLLLHEHYDLKKDILYPATITSVAVSCIVIVANMISPFELFTFFEGYSYSFLTKMLTALFTVIKYDIQLLLLWISGLAVLIKMVTRSKSTDLVMYVSIVLIAFLFNLGSSIWHLGAGLVLSSPMLVFGPAMRCGIDVVLGVLFWKKGFETAVLCHLIIVFLFYAIMPILVLR
jgi:hypothetical protein